MRSVTGLPDNDLDHATVCGNHDETPYTPAHPLGRELSAEEVSMELRKILTRLTERMAEHSTHRCPHGINLERAACGQCMREDEDMGAAMSARWEKR